MLKLITPPLLVHLGKRLHGNESTEIYGLSGDYCSWEEAIDASTGYDSRIILEKTKAALLKVKNGESAYERDSVLFDEIQYSWPLLAGILWAAARNGGVLNVLDFGGSLGSSYYQNRIFLSSLPQVRWNIVEQSSHVGIGKAYFEDNNLHFYLSIAECLADTQPNVILLSSVLQYLEHPYIVLDQLLELPCDHVIINRTPFWTGLSDRLCVQTVPSTIYPASYPSWIFSTPSFYSYLNEKWKIIAEFESLDRLRGPVKILWRGLIIERRKHVTSMM